MGRATVWVISGEQWPRAYLRAELIERGFDAAGFAGLADALAALSTPRATPPVVIALDLCDLLLTGEDLSALTRTGIPVVLLGGVLDLPPERFSRGACARILRRPFTIGQAADAVEEVWRNPFRSP